MTNKLFKFNSQGRLAFKESILKGIKKYFVEGYASTTEKDLAGEVINDSAQLSMLRQFRQRNITIDIEHEEWYDDDGKKLNKPKSAMIPVAKVIEAKLDPKGTWVKAELNTNIKRFDEVWGSIKDGFLNAFSIGFFPISQSGNVISDLNIVNLTLTGTPVNTGATFTPVLKSAVAYLKSIEKESEQKMETPNETPVEQPEAAPVEAPVVETPAVEAPVATPAPVAEPANELKTEVEIKQENKITEPVKPEATQVQPTNEQIEPKNNEADISKLVEKVMEQKFKEFEERLVPKQVKPDVEPNKAPDAGQPAPQEVTSKPISPLSMIKAFQKRKGELDNNPRLKALVENTPDVERQEVKKNKTPLQLV